MDTPSWRPSPSAKDRRMSVPSGLLWRIDEQLPKKLSSNSLPMLAHKHRATDADLVSAYRNMEGDLALTARSANAPYRYISSESCSEAGSEELLDRDMPNTNADGFQQWQEEMQKTLALRKQNGRLSNK